MLEIYMAVENWVEYGFKPKQNELGWADLHFDSISKYW